MTGSFPAFHSSFLGRKSELDEAQALLQTRWLTITGPGGVGKTRFATVLSQDLEPRHFVDASSLGSASAVLATIRETLGLPPTAPQPTALELPEPVWLVVDNLEHIEDASRVMAGLCAANPQLGLICTSITPLGSSAEQLYPLAPLPVTPEAPDGAVALFIERARARRPQWQPSPEELGLISKLCAALDGLPLAIELVAARSHSLPLGAMLNRLLGQRPLPTDDPSRIARHATLPAVLDWSWNLLSDAERLGLTALAWLETSFTLPFAARLLAPLQLDSGTPVALVEKALMHQENDRYHLLSTVRSYVRQRSVAPETLWAALAETVAPLVLEVFPEGPRGPVTAKTMQRFNALEPDWPHLQTSLDWQLRHGDTNLAWAVVDRLTMPLLAKGYVRQLPPLFEAVLAAPELEPPRRLRALALYSIALSELNDVRLSEICRQGMALAETLGDEARLVTFAINLGNYLAHMGQLEEATESFEQALIAAERLEKRDAMVILTGNLGYIRIQQERYPEALHLVNRSLQLSSEDEVETRSINHSYLAQIHLELGDTPSALQHARSAISLIRDYDLTDILPLALGRLVALAEQLEATALVAALEALLARSPAPEAAIADLATSDWELISSAVHSLEALVAPTSRLVLSPREHEILRHLVSGASNRSIAEALGISPVTVRNRLSELYEKLNVKTRTEAIRVAMTERLVI